jgi:hypothetical protein
MASRSASSWTRLLATVLNTLYPQLPIVKGAPNTVFPFVQEVSRQPAARRELHRQHMMNPSGRPPNMCSRGRGASGRCWGEGRGSCGGRHGGRPRAVRACDGPPRQLWDADDQCFKHGTRVRNALEYLRACEVRDAPRTRLHGSQQPR